MGGLFLLASSLDVMYDANLTLPLVGDSALDLTGYMPTIPNVTFDLVTIEQLNSDDFEYKIEFTYTRSGTDFDIKFETRHIAGATENQYKGLMRYQIEDHDPWGGNCGSSDVTRKGSLLYERTAETVFKVDSREADFCRHDTTWAGFGSDDQLDPTYRLGSYSNGWGNGYNSFVSNYDSSNKSGQYSYVWQAGAFDGHSRALQIDLNDHSPVDGEAYFGFAAQVYDPTATLGEKQGMICNWAAPGSTNMVQLYAQRQFLTFNSTTNYFETTAGGSDITYAPTNNCLYDGSGSFAYDRDLNGSIDANDIAIVKVGASGASELEFDLFSYTGSTVAEMIENRGTHLPVGPTWP